MRTVFELSGGTTTITNGNPTTTQLVHLPGAYQGAAKFAGACSLVGSVRLDSGTATTMYANVKLVFGHDEITGNKLKSDTFQQITLVNSTGGNTVDKLTSTGNSMTFEIDLADQSWWKPCGGLELYLDGATGTFVATVQANLIPTRNY